MKQLVLIAATYWLGVCVGPGFALGQVAGPVVAGNQPVVAETQPLELTTDEARDSVQWLVDLAIRQVPPTYQGDDDWGNTKRVWAGLHVKREGLELKTHRRFKDVSHGRWVKYELAFPADFSLQQASGGVNPVQIEQVELGPDQRWHVTGTIVAPLEFKCRVERWNLGFQWYSVSIEGNLRVKMNFSASLSMHADYSEVPPAIVVDPQIETAELRLEHFEVDRISKIGGDVAEELGEVIEKILRDKWLKKENARLPERLNRAIAKKQDKLRFSWTAWFAKWQ